MDGHAHWTLPALPLHLFCPMHVEHTLVVLHATVSLKYAADRHGAMPPQVGGIVAEGSDDRLEMAVTAVARTALLLDGPRRHGWDAQGLSLPPLRPLFRIRQTPGIGVTDLATALGVSASNITQQVEKPVGRGLMKRVERATNRRHACLMIKSIGEQVAGEYVDTARNNLRRALTGMSEPELDQLTTLLARVINRALIQQSNPVPSGRESANVSGTR